MEENIDPFEVLAALGVADARTAERVRGGFDLLIWRVERPGGAFALRLFRPGQEQTCRKEQLVMDAAAAAGLPVPGVCAAGEWRGRPALLLEWCPGEVLVQALQRAPHQFWRLGLAFGRTQAQLHTVAPPAPLLDDADGWLRWSGDGEEALQRRLRSLAQGRPALLHLDYHPLNVLAAEGRISAVLDWSNARAGDPRADVARTHSILLAEPMGRRLPLVLRLGRYVLAFAWQAGYRRAAGPPQEMAAFYAWAGAVMQRDLAHRVGKPGGPTPEGMAGLRRWTERWKRRAGVA